MDRRPARSSPGRAHLYLLEILPECLGPRLRPAVARRLVAAGVDREVRGWEKASDHAPAWINLGDVDRVRAPTPKRRPARAGYRPGSANVGSVPRQPPHG